MLAYSCDVCKRLFKGKPHIIMSYDKDVNINWGGQKIVFKRLDICQMCQSKILNTIKDNMN